MSSTFTEWYLRAQDPDPVEDAEYLSLVDDLLAQPGIRNLDRYDQHRDTTTLTHVRAVSYLSYRICKQHDWDYAAAARAGILHDFVTYDWHEAGDGSHRLHGFRHPGFAVTNASAITTLSTVEENAIRRHMWPLTPVPPRYREGWVLTLVDKHCATLESLGRIPAVTEE